MEENCPDGDMNLNQIQAFLRWNKMAIHFALMICHAKNDINKLIIYKYQLIISLPLFNANMRVKNLGHEWIYNSHMEI